MVNPLLIVFQQIAAILKTAGVDESVALKSLQESKIPAHGDVSSTIGFSLAKERNENPAKLANEVKEKLKLEGQSIVEKVEVAGPYVNFWLNKNEFAKIVVSNVRKDYGADNQNKKIVIDYSSPNIAKPLSIAHLRSTIIGDSLARINSFLGNEVVSINYLGDWGTQFGKLLAAYEMWGNEEDLEKREVNALLDLYVRFHQEIEKDKLLEQKGRDWFKKLEDGDEKATKLWEWFKDISLREFLRVYDLLNVNFNELEGESIAAKECPKVVDNLLEKGIAKRDPDGSVIVPMKNMANFIILKSDETTLYSTRDIWTALNRYEKYKFDKMLYVVSSEQNLHFKQLFETLKIAGNEWANNCQHINFGMLHAPGGEKFSTRKGNVIFLEDVLNEGIKRAEEIILQKSANLKHEEVKSISRMIGVGAVKFADLSTDRIRDIAFEWDKALNFEGDSGPYLQYTHARACRLIEKAESRGTFTSIKENEEYILVKEIAKFPNIVLASAKDSKPNYIADYLLKLSAAFNSFYNKCSVLDSEKETKESRVAIVNATRITLRNGLKLLGIDAPEKM